MGPSLVTTNPSRTFEMHGVAFHSFVSSSTGARELAAWRADFDPHTPGTAHTMNHEEVLHVLTGQLEVEVDDSHFTATSGDAVLVPAGAHFRVSNETYSSASAWVVTTLGMRATMPDGEAITPPWAQ